MSGVEGKDGNEVQPKEKSHLAIIRERLEGLANEGKVHFAGDYPFVSPASKYAPSQPSTENIYMFVGILEPRSSETSEGPFNLFVATHQLVERLRLENKLDPGIDVGKDVGAITFLEDIGTSELQINNKITVVDMSDEMKKEVANHIANTSVVRRIEVRVYEGKELADLEYKYYSEDIDRREYRRLRRHLRYPKIKAIFDSLSRHKPQQPQK